MARQSRAYRQRTDCCWRPAGTKYCWSDRSISVAIGTLWTLGATGAGNDLGDLNHPVDAQCLWRGVSVDARRAISGQRTNVCQHWRHLYAANHCLDPLPVMAQGSRLHVFSPCGCRWGSSPIGHSGDCRCAVATVLVLGRRNCRRLIGHHPDRNMDRHSPIRRAGIRDINGMTSEICDQQLGQNSSIDCITLRPHV